MGRPRQAAVDISFSLLLCRSFRARRRRALPPKRGFGKGERTLRFKERAVIFGARLPDEWLRGARACARHHDGGSAGHVVGSKAHVHVTGGEG